MALSESIAAVRRLTVFYVKEFNALLPHSAFKGQTPDEMYFGTGLRVEEQIEAGKAMARENRLEENRNVACDECRVRPEDPLTAVA